MKKMKESMRKKKRKKKMNQSMKDSEGIICTMKKKRT